MYSSQNSNKLQLPASAHVDDRELLLTQASTDRHKGTRTTAMTIQDDLGRLTAARIAWHERPEFVETKPKSKPELAEQPAAPSEPVQYFPGQALGRGLALILRHQPSSMRLSRLHPEGNGAICCVWGDICPFDDFVLRSI